jgi:hypothetical protein
MNRRIAATSTKRWMADPDRAVYVGAATGPFASFLSDVAGIRPVEAEELAAAVMREWRASGGEEDARSLGDLSDVVITVVFGLFLAAVAVVAALALAALERLVRRS